MAVLVFCFFFFFQAEDGIRDVAVTGVQTCALPIYAREDPRLPAARDCCRPTEAPDQFELADPALTHQWRLEGAAATGRRLIVERRDGTADLGCAQIGRASCRERV